jgi:hypothetical protein
MHNMEIFLPGDNGELKKSGEFSLDSEINKEGELVAIIKDNEGNLVGDIFASQKKEESQ